MKLQVKCDRCGKLIEGEEAAIAEDDDGLDKCKSCYAKDAICSLERANEQDRTHINYLQSQINERLEKIAEYQKEVTP